MAPFDLLTFEVPGDDGNQRVYLTLPDGRKLPLPFPWRVEEFALPGNLEIQADGRLFALYDPSTRTGAFFCDGTDTDMPFWTIWQPCLRDDFFGRMVPGAVAQAMARIA